MMDTEIVTQARAWVDSLTDKWRVQVISNRTASRRRKVKAPVKLRRFVEGVPWAFVKPALDYLISLAPYRGIIANGVDFNIAFRPTLTTWQRDSQSAAFGSRGDATYTLIQDLIDAESDDVYALSTSNSCTETVETSYVWDSDAVDELPEGGVGVTYQVASVSRNEDGTFNYALVKRIARTQHTPETVVEDNRVQKVTVETWDNVYPVGGVYCDDQGDALGVPQAGIFDRTEVKIAQVAKNPDCTVKIQATRETTKKHRSRRQTTQTIFEKTEETGETGADQALSEAPAASGGTIKTHESQQQPNGTYSTMERTQNELSVPDAEVEVTRNRRGIRTTKTHRNQPAQPSTSVSNGDTVRFKKTPGGLYDVTYSSFSARTSGSIGSGCKKDAYTHTDTTVKAASSVDIGHVTGGTGGKVVSKDATMDDDGIVTVTTRTEQEKSVKGAAATWHVSPEGSIASVKDAAQTAKPRKPSFSRANIGRDVSYTVTPGGLYTVENKEPGASDATVTVESSTSDKSTETRTVTRTVRESRGEVSTEGSSVSSGGGVYREKTVRVNQLGNVDTSVTSVKEHARVSSASYRATSRGTVKTVTTFSKTGAVETSGSSGHSVTNELTPGGRYTVSETEPYTTRVDSAHSASDAYQTESDDVTVTTGAVINSMVDSGGGIYRTRDVTADDNGFVRTVVRVVREIPGTHQSSSESDLFHRVSRTVKRELAFQTDNGNNPAPGVPTPLVKRSGQLTRGGLWDVDEVVDTPRFQTWKDSLDTDLYVMRTFYYRNASASEREAVKANALNEWNSLRSKYASSGWGFSPKAPTHAKMQPSSSLNAYGAYDGYYAIELSWAPESGGAGVNHATNLQEIASWSYKTVSNSFQIGVRSSGTDDNPSVTVQRTIQTKCVTEDIYCGWKQYVESRFGSGNILFEGSHVSVTPSTGVAHGVRVTEATTKVEIMETASMTPIKWGE